jgi:hypothetical protein
MVSVDTSPYTTLDARGTMRALGPWWEQLLEGRASASAREAARRSAEDLRRRLGVDETVDEPIDALHQLGMLASALPTADPEVLGAALAALDQAATTLRADGAFPARAEGTVAHLHLSDGGVPKRPVFAVDVERDGVVGDRQASRQHHGRPWQALSLWSVEVIDQLAAEGHPIAPGRAGENITLAGLAWHDVRAGVRLRIGTVLAEVSVFALPCAKNAQWFIGGDFNRMHHTRGAVSRAYASVLEPGHIDLGDAAILEP